MYKLEFGEELPPIPLFTKRNETKRSYSKAWI